MNSPVSLSICKAFTPRLSLLLRQLLCLFLLQVNMPVLVTAAELTGLYQASVAVTSRDDTRAQQQAFQAAMRKVLVKLSGRTDILSNPLITSALGSPQSYVEAWAYRNLPALAAVEGQSPVAEQLTLEATFFATQLHNLLESAGIPVWPQNRPDTLLWVVVQDAPGQRSYPGLNENGSELLKTLVSHASDKGLPLIMPILDLEDQFTLRPDVLWSLDVTAITAASQRYQTESILALRLYPLPGGQVFGKAVYMFRGQAVELEALESPLATFLEDSVSLAARELAATYSVVLSGVDSGTRVNLMVNGIDSIAAYAGLLRYLESIAVVQGVQVLSVRDKVVELELRTGGQLRQLIESIALDRKLLPLAEPVRENQQVSLSYQWQRS